MTYKQFFAELILRLTSKSPKFFVVIQNISLALMIVAFIPEILTDFNIVLPEKTTLIITRIVGACATISAILSKLPVAEDKLNKPLPFTDLKK